MVQERRGMLKVWNLSLIVGTFALTVLGTFLTRGSILASVHTFAESIVGPLYLVFLTVVLLGGFGLIAWRREALRGEAAFDTPLSRESVFLGNNVLLLVLTFTVLVGTIYPLLAEAVTNQKVSVGSPFFNRNTAPVALLLLFLMGHRAAAAVAGGVAVGGAAPAAGAGVGGGGRGGVLGDGRHGCARRWWCSGWPRSWPRPPSPRWCAACRAQRRAHGYSVAAATRAAVSRNHRLTAGSSSTSG
jgi:hypothetical protein